METRTVPERVINHVDVNMASVDRAASAFLGVALAALSLRSNRWSSRLAFGLSSLTLLTRSFTGHSRLYAEKLSTLATSTPVSVPHQSSITIQGSLEEVESFLLDEAPVSVSLSYNALLAGTQIEVRAQSATEDDVFLRKLLRRAKQMIETGEIARSDERVRGGES